MVASLLLAAGQLPWEAGLRSEGQVFSGLAADLQLEPRLGIGYETRELVFHAFYHPELFLREPRSLGTFDTLQQESVDGAFRLEHDTTIRVAQDLSLGSTSLSWLAYTPDTPLPLIVRSARSASVDMLNENSSLTLDEAITRRLHFLGTVRYSIAGGMGDGLLLFPRTNTIDLSASSSWLERRDSFTLAVDGNRGWISTSGDTWLFDTTATWRHAFNSASERLLAGQELVHLGERPQPRYETELVGGVAVLGGSGGVQHSTLPTAGFTIRRDEVTPRIGAVGVRTSFRYAPVLDVATGAPTPRYETSATADLRIHRQVVTFTSGSLAYTNEPNPPLPKALAQGALGLTYELTPNLSISAAGRVARLAEVEWGAIVTTTITQRGRF